MALANHPNPEGGSATPGSEADADAVRRAFAFEPTTGQPGPRVVRDSWDGRPEHRARHTPPEQVLEDVDYMAPPPEQGRAAVLAKLAAAWAAGHLQGYEDARDDEHHEDCHDDCGPDEAEEQGLARLADAVESLHHLAHGEEPVTLCLSEPCKGARPQLDERAAHRYRGLPLAAELQQPVETVAVEGAVL